MRTNPLTVEILLRAYYTPSPHPDINTTAGVGAVDTLIALGAVERIGPAQLPYITEKGKAWVAMILATPLPLAAWVHPGTGQKIEDL